MLEVEDVGAVLPYPQAQKAEIGFGEYHTQIIGVPFNAAFPELGRGQLWWRLTAYGIMGIAQPRTLSAHRTGEKR